MYKKLNLPHIHIILVTSGLGNQMFCYAYYQALKKTYSNSIFLLDSDSHIYGHYGLEIFNVLHCRGEWRWYLYKRYILVFSVNLPLLNKSMRLPMNHWIRL